MAKEQPRPFETSRRAILGSLGATISGLALAGGSAATGIQTDSEQQIVLRQGDQCVHVTPFSEEKAVEEFYGYRLAEKYISDENGGRQPGNGEYFASTGTASLQRDGESVLFFYNGSEGLSLVIVHGSFENTSSGGGAATFDIAGLPEDGSWAVKDDYYTDPNTKNIANSNFDNWDLVGDTATIDWTWGDVRTDGGAFRGLGDEFSITIDPAFNEEASLHDEYYSGTVESWQFLAPDGDAVQRTELDMSAEVTIETGDCENSSGDGNGEAGSADDDESGDDDGLDIFGDGE